MKISSFKHLWNAFPIRSDSLQKSKRLSLPSGNEYFISLRFAYLLLTFMFISKPSFAQFTEEMGDIFYDIGFRFVTTDIDPIEGLYSVSTDSKVMLNDEVLKQQRTEGDITIYSNSSGAIRDYNNKFEFCRIGRTQTYDVNVLWPKYNITQHERIRIKCTDFFDVSFSLTYEMPQQEVKALFGEYYVPGLKAVYTIHCKKILPNREMVDEVISVLKKRKEAIP